MGAALLIIALLGVVVWIARSSMAEESPDSRSQPQKSRADYREGALGARAAEVTRIPVTVTMTMQFTDQETAQSDLDIGGEDEWAAVAPHPVRSNTLVDLVYQDGGGKQSRRRVTVREFDYAAPRHLFCFCHLRKATRTFYVSRVQEAVDPETGEVLVSLHEFLRSRYEASPERSLDVLFSVQRGAMRALLYVGRADGRLMKAERAIIQRVARQLTEDNRITDAQIDAVLSEFETPSKAVFQSFVRTMATEQSLDRRLAVLRGAEDMVATQSTVHPDEQSALEYMRKRLVHPGGAAPLAEPDANLGIGSSLEQRQRDAAVLLAAREAELRRNKARVDDEEAAEALLPAQCGVCFYVSGARLPVAVGAPVGTVARCAQCGFDQVLTEEGAKRPENLLIPHVYEGRPLPAGVRSEVSLPRDNFGYFVGKRQARHLDAEAALQGLIEAFSRRTLVEPAYSIEKARILDECEHDLRALSSAMDFEYATLRAQEEKARESLRKL
jgi:uncharacterized tellurite resistance protein B-like protein